MLERQANSALLSMAHIAGDPGLMARALAEREALKQRTTNVNVSNSVVGAINTGTVKSMSVKMHHLAQNPATAEVATAFTEMASAVVSSRSLTSKTKSEVTEQLSFLVEQASIAPGQRKPALIKPILSALQTALSTTADSLALWNQWGPAILAFFGS